MRKDYKEMLPVYSEEIRLRIALLVLNSEICVNCLVAVLGLPQSTISRHIGTMRRAGVILAERKRTNTYYSANMENTEIGNLNRDLISTYLKHIKNESPFREDREGLLKQKDICTVDCKVAC